MNFLIAVENFLKKKIGLDPVIFGRNNLQKIIQKRQNILGITESENYLNLLKTSIGELSELVEEIVVPETWFFRDRQPFEYLKSYISNYKISRPLQILSAPSSTGEEAYSIAITLLEIGLTSAHFCIEAIDISKNAILKAERGLYKKNSFRGEDFVERQKYFQKIGEEYQLSPEIRKTVVFKQKNLLNFSEFKDSKYDIIFCRNLLIYLDPVIANQIMNLLARLLKPDGILFVGSAETSQVPLDQFVSLRQPFTFAYQKVTPKATASKTSQKKPQPRPSVTISSQQTSKVDLNIARELANQGKLTEAIHLCQVYLKESSLNAEGYLLLGEIYQALSKDSQAREYFQKALYLNPNHHQALTHLILLKEQQGATREVQVLKKRLERLTQSQQS